MKTALQRTNRAKCIHTALSCTSYGWHICHHR